MHVSVAHCESARIVGRPPLVELAAYCCQKRLSVVEVLVQSTSDRNDGDDGAQCCCTAQVLLVRRTFPQLFVGVVLNRHRLRSAAEL